jgi:hypothetical protein
MKFRRAGIATSIFFGIAYNTVLLFLLLMACICFREEEIVKYRYKLCAFKNTTSQESSANGSAFLLVGGFNYQSGEKDYYKFLIDSNDGMRLQKVDALNGNVTIKEIDIAANEAYIEQYWRVSSPNLFLKKWVSMSKNPGIWYEGIQKQILYIPKGSVARDFNFKL